MSKTMWTMYGQPMLAKKLREKNETDPIQDRLTALENTIADNEAQRENRRKEREARRKTTGSNDILGDTGNISRRRVLGVD